MNHDQLISKINWDIARKLPYRGRVVDMGCGSAPYRELILAKAEEYVGVDWASSTHDQRHVDVFADLSGPLPLESDWADTITAFQVLEHLREPEAFLRECRRILRRGGQLLITVPFMWPVHEAPHDYYRYTRHGLQYPSCWADRCYDPAANRAGAVSRQPRHVWPPGNPLARSPMIT